MEATPSVDTWASPRSCGHQGQQSPNTCALLGPAPSSYDRTFNGTNGARGRKLIFYSFIRKMKVLKKFWEPISMGAVEKKIMGGGGS